MGEALAIGVGAIPAIVSANWRFNLSRSASDLRTTGVSAEREPLLQSKTESIRHVKQFGLQNKGDKLLASQTRQPSAGN